MGAALESDETIEQPLLIGVQCVERFTLAPGGRQEVADKSLAHVVFAIDDVEQHGIAAPLHEDLTAETAWRATRKFATKDRNDL